MSGAPLPASAAVLNLFWASPNGTGCRLMSTSGYSASNFLMRASNAGPSLVGSEVSHQVSDPETSEAWGAESVLVSVSPSPDPQAVANRLTAATRAPA